MKGLFSGEPSSHHIPQFLNLFSFCDKVKMGQGKHASQEDLNLMGESCGLVSSLVYYSEDCRCRDALFLYYLQYNT